MVPLIIVLLCFQNSQKSTTLTDLAEKAMRHEQIMQHDHVISGLVIPTIIHPNSHNPAVTAGSYENVCSHSGEYLQAECFQFAVTSSPSARKNAIATALAMLKLETVTGTPGCLARAFKQANTPGTEEKSYFYPEKWHSSQSMPGYRWLGDADVYQLTDWVIGLTTFFDLVANTAEKLQIKAGMSRVMGMVADSNMRIIDVDGKMTLLGNMSPSLPHDHLNALLALENLLCAFRVTREQRFMNEYLRLTKYEHYAEEAVLSKKLTPEWDIKGTDDLLAMKALDRLLTYEQGAPLRDLYKAALRRNWIEMQFAHNPFFDLVVERHLREGIDSHTINWLSAYRCEPEPRKEKIRSQNGETEIEGTWQDDPSEFLMTYWYGRYHHLIEKAAQLHDMNTPPRPDGPIYKLPETPLPSIPLDLDSMLKVDAGPFIAGSEAGDPDEAPERKEIVPVFWIDKYLVTNLQYSRFDKNWIYPEGKDICPALVSWNHAASYAKYYHKRLPTETEWEKAARGTDGRLFPWGNIYDRSLVASVEGAPQGRSTPCVSPYGCVDMAGNVWQWTSSWYSGNLGSQFRNQAMGQKYRVIRGGSASVDRSHLRCAHRYYTSPQTLISGYSIGFRCVQDSAPAN